MISKRVKNAALPSYPLPPLPPPPSSPALPLPPPPSSVSTLTSNSVATPQTKLEPGVMPSKFASLSQSPKCSTHCDCGLPVVLKKSWTVENPGRRFISCKYDDQETGQKGCKFSMWVDEGMVEWQREITNELVMDKKMLMSKITLLEKEISRHKEEKWKMDSEIQELKSKVVTPIVRKGITGVQLAICASISVICSVVIFHLIQN